MTPAQPHLLALLTAATARRAREAVASLERAGFGWTALGGKEGNFGLINIGSDPAVAFVERITNAIDAVIERAARDADPAVVAAFDSPREAVAQLFAVREGRLGSHPSERLDALATHTTVAIADGESAQRPTLEVRDDGVGIAPELMPHSILDLAGSNKLDKPYLAGAYGQGGSTTFGFTRGGTMIASSVDGDRVGITFVRYRELDPRRNKNGRYDFLVDPSGKIAALRVTPATFARGTLVRHFDYELPHHSGVLDAREDGLRDLVSAALFDPVLPVRLVDRRSRARGPRTLVHSGSARALDQAARSLVELRQSFEIPLGRHGCDGMLALHCWLLAAADVAARLRPDPRSPVAVTNFGQTHDAWSRAFIVDELKLPFLKDGLVVQVELDGLAPAAKRALLSTTRDRLKRGDVFTALHAAVRDALVDDAALQRANIDRRRHLLARQRAADQERLQRRFAELMETFRPGNVPAPSGDGAAGTEVPRSSPPGRIALELEFPLPTREHPTYVRFARAEPLTLPSQRPVRVVLESDAPDGYIAHHAEARLIVVSQPFDAVSFVRASDFRAGRARAIVRADAPPGADGVLTVRLTDAAGIVLTAQAPFLVVAPPPPQTNGCDGRKGIRVPNVYEVMRDRWHEHGFDERSVATVSESRDDVSIFVNMDNGHLTRLIDVVPYQQTGITRMRSAFLVQIAFYAFLQHRARDVASAIDPDALDRYQREELDRVAQTVVASIASVERIESRALLEVE